MPREPDRVDVCADDDVRICRHALRVRLRRMEHAVNVERNHAGLPHINDVMPRIDRHGVCRCRSRQEAVVPSAETAACRVVREDAEVDCVLEIEHVPACPDRRAVPQLDGKIARSEIERSIERRAHPRTGAVESHRGPEIRKRTRRTECAVLIDSILRRARHIVCSSARRFIKRPKRDR